MKPIYGMEIKKSTSSTAPLPAGGYVAKILNAEVKEYTWGDVMILSFDVAEGEYKDFFAEQYRANTNEDKKWKGNFRLNVPNESNQYFENQKKTFGNAIWAIEESNNGYHWAWDESTLKGKMVGVLYRNYEYDIDGRTGWSTECCTLVSVDDIRSGNFRMPKDKPLKNKATNTAQSNLPKFEPVEDFDDLPFN